MDFDPRDDDSRDVLSFTRGGHALRLKTDANGEVYFTLAEPAPPHLRVLALLSPIDWDCGCSGGGATADVIQRGVVELHNGNFHSGKPTKFAASLKATPGQILIPVRHLFFFEQLYMATIGL